MPEKRRDEWKIITGPPGIEGRGVYLNDQKFPAVLGVRLEVSTDERAHLTLDLAPHRVTVVTEPVLTLIVNQRRFQVVEEPRRPS